MRNQTSKRYLYIYVRVLIFYFYFKNTGKRIMPLVIDAKKSMLKIET
jgi:hypothetical protein